MIIIGTRITRVNPTTILDNIINEKDLKYDIKNSAEELLGEIEYYLDK